MHVGACRSLIGCEVIIERPIASWIPDTQRVSRFVDRKVLPTGGEASVWITWQLAQKRWLAVTSEAVWPSRATRCEGLSFGACVRAVMSVGDDGLWHRRHLFSARPNL